MKTVKSIAMKCSPFLLSCLFLLFPLLSHAQVSSRDIPVGDFTKIEVDGPFNITMSSSKNQLKAVSSDNIFDWLVVSNVDGTLKISIDEKKKKSWKTLWGNTVSVDLFIGCAQVNEIHLNGVGKITTLNALKGENLTIVINGVNRSEMEVDVKDLKLNISGIGEYIFKGITDKASIDFSGIGNFNAFGLDAKSVFMNGSGIGNCSLRATEEIVLNSSGIGNISYSGSPKKQQINKSGLGSVSEQ